MDEPLRIPSPQSAVEYEAAIDQLLTEVKRLNEQMGADRVEINRLKSETHELKVETRAVLAKLGSRL